ncbi:MAG: stage V sporulation protein D, partial [Candidatus Omnitrophica bacterium CG12_big_fil_rev_8_21_14_0_65_50_5]
VILTGAVEKGTGKMARIKGISVAGKTGTAQKIINGQYSHDAFFASFIGFAPVDNPKLAAIVVFDDPQGSHFGGTVAAPVFKDVIEKSLKYLDSMGYFLIPRT